MKTRNFIIFCILAVAAGCSPSTSSNSSGSFTNSDAENSGNVSGIYELAAYGTVGSWTGVDIKWKNSKGIIQAVSAYGDSGKPALVSFWATTNDTDASEIPALIFPSKKIWAKCRNRYRGGKQQLSDVSHRCNFEGA